MNVFDIAIIVLLTLAVVFALRHIRKMRKSGCSCCTAESDCPVGCTGSCASCKMTCSHKEK